MPPHCEADEGDQQADTDRHRVLERLGDGGDQALAQTDAGGEDEDHPGNRDRAERDLPGDVHADDDREREEEVVPHRRRYRDGIVGEERHQERRDAARKAGRGEHRGEIHPRGAEHGRLDKMMYAIVRNVVMPAMISGPYGRPVLGKPEEALDHSEIVFESRVGEVAVFEAADDVPAAAREPAGGQFQGEVVVQLRRGDASRRNPSLRVGCKP